MGINRPQTLEKTWEEFNRSDNALGLFPYEGVCDTDIKTSLSQLRSKAFKQVWAFVGSEGGFSDREKESFSRKGLKPMTLGAQVLRVETACLVLLSVLKYEFDLMTV